MGLFCLSVYNVHIESMAMRTWRWIFESIHIKFETEPIRPSLCYRFMLRFY